MEKRKAHYDLDTVKAVVRLVLTRLRGNAFRDVASRLRLMHFIAKAAGTLAAARRWLHSFASRGNETNISYLLSDYANVL